MSTSDTQSTAAPLSAELVHELYRQYLGRDPESASVVDEHLRSHPSIESFVTTLAQSPEHMRRAALVDARRELLSLGSSTHNDIEVDVPSPLLQQLFARTQRQWATLGATEPHWSVVSAPEFRKELFENNRNAFFKSGEDAATLLDAFCKRNHFTGSRGTLIELGCGVGRVTVHLAKVFKRIIAVDISPGNLAICEAQLRELKLHNVDTSLLRSPSQLHELPKCDFVYSVIVLQHNPPPVAAFFLKALLQRVNAGGAAVFQVPTHTPGYSFKASEYLGSSQPANGMEMHCLPMNTIYKTLAECDFQIQETLADSWTGSAGSHTFFATRR
jgi:SAM-dependent methyltransferase